MVVSYTYKQKKQAKSIVFEADRQLAIPIDVSTMYGGSDRNGRNTFR